HRARDDTRRHAAPGRPAPILPQRSGRHAGRDPEPPAGGARTAADDLPPEDGPAQPRRRGSGRPLHRSVAARRQRDGHDDAALARGADHARRDEWMRGLGAPLLHFLVGGGALFWLVHVRPAERPAPIVVTADDVGRLRLEYTRDTGLEPTTADEATLVEK